MTCLYWLGEKVSREMSMRSWFQEGNLDDVVCT